MQYLACASSPDAPAAPPCPAGTALVLADPLAAVALPTPEDFDVGAYGFAFVVLAYVLGAGFGVILRLFRS